MMAILQDMKTHENLHIIIIKGTIFDALKLWIVVCYILKYPVTSVTGLLGDPDENRTRVTAVKGRCLNLLTTGPK